MTAYAAHELRTINGILLIEIRAVNHRYLELQLKLDDHCRAYESQVREQLNTSLGRGKIDCRISLMQDAAADASLNLNHTALQQIAAAANSAAQYFPHAQGVNMLDVLRMPGVMASNAVDINALESDIKRCLDNVIGALVAARAREGEKLKTLIVARLNEVAHLVREIKPLLPALVQAHQAKLLAKFNDSSVHVDDERLRQEMLLFMQRADVDEELSRLEAHIEEVEHILAKGGLVGKRLDFMMQEMNREANTLGSKSVGIQTTQASIALKVLIEQMREQIQNIA